MKADTRFFGTVDIDNNKVIYFAKGIIGFPDLKTFTLIQDKENKDHHIRWLQSMDEPAFAMPVIDPLLVTDEYTPKVPMSEVPGAENLNTGEFVLLVTMTIPEDIKNMSVNLNAPIIINMKTREAAQVTTENQYATKTMIYHYLQAKKEQ